MKTKFSLLLTALLMLFCMSTNAQSITGDVNGDNLVNDEDIEEVVKIITGTSELENPDVAGDVTGDSHVNVADIVAIVNIMQEPGNPAVTFSLKITNNTGSDVTLDGTVSFVLGNPDHNNYYLGWNGSYNATDILRFSETAVTIAAGESQIFNGICWKDKDTGMGMGDKSPANSEQIADANMSRNVMVYVGDNPETVLCENMSTDIIFQQDGIYEIVLPGSGSDPVDPDPEDPDPVVPVDPDAGNPVINFGVNITNNTGAAVTLDGRLRFVIGNPDHNGVYYGGYTGHYLRTDNIWFSGSEEVMNPVTLAAGETKTFSNLTWKDADTGCGLGETSPLDPTYLPIYDDDGGIAYARNILIYIDGRSDLTLCDNLSSSIVFQEGGVYDISISSSSSDPEDPEDPDPVVPIDPDAGNPVINFGVNITNNTGAAVTLDGRLRFVLGNPDHNGVYYGGYTGHYLRTDNIWFSNGSVTLAAGETMTFYNLTWQDADTGCGLGETSPLDPAYLPIYADDGGIAYARNILLYIDGRSDLILCDNMSSSIVFQEGGVYDISISGGSTPTPTPTPSGEGNPVISFGVNITNAHGSAVTLDGRLRFVIGNPDHNGYYYGGYTGYYLRTDNIWFSNGSVTLAAGETKTFYGLTWQDADTKCGLGETSPLDPAYLPIYADDGGIAYARNILIYIDGRSDLILCDNLSASIVFQEGGVYDVVIR